MGRSWVDDDAWELVERASSLTGRDVAHLLLEADEVELSRTCNAQLAVFVLGLVVDQALRRSGLVPSACAGHSVGEYTALASAGVASFEDALYLIAERAEAMQLADEENQGTMSAVLGLDYEDADVACSRSDGDAWVANFNAPQRTVIAGAPAAVAEATRVSVELGASHVVPLRVGGAYHTRFMAPARPRLRAALAKTTFTKSGTPVAANIDGRLHGGDIDWPALLSAHLLSPVRWHHSMRRLRATGTHTYVQVGPGSELGILVRQSLPDARVATVRTPVDLGMAKMIVAGEPLAHDAFEGIGETLQITERLIISPATGIYRPEPSPVVMADGTVLAEGDTVGTVGSVPVRSRFSGRLMGLLAIEGERVRKGQAVAWLRLHDPDVADGGHTSGSTSVVMSRSTSTSRPLVSGASPS